MKSLAHIIIAIMLLMTMSSMLYAETTYAEAKAKANATEQSEDLFADIGGTPLNDEQADVIEGDVICAGLCVGFVGVLTGIGAAVVGIHLSRT